MGGYDGGVELGFDGKWPDKTFEQLIATAIAMQYGKQPSKQQLMQLVNAVLATIDDRILERTNESAEEFQVKTGVECGL